MNRFGIEVTPKHSPKLDPDYTPLYLFNQAFLKEAKKPLGIAVERASGQMAVTRTFIHGTPDKRDADLYYVDRLVKSLLWVKGGFKVYICGDEDVYQTIKAAYAPGGSRASPAPPRRACRFAAAVFPAVLLCSLTSANRPFSAVLSLFFSKSSCPLTRPCGPTSEGSFSFSIMLP